MTGRYARGARYDGGDYRWPGSDGAYPGPVGDRYIRYPSRTGARYYVSAGMPHGLGGLRDGSPSWEGDPAPKRPTRRYVPGEWDTDDWESVELEPWLDYQARRRKRQARARARARRDEHARALGVPSWDSSYGT